MLWPDATEDRARASLRSALWQAGQIAPGLLRANGSVQLDVEVEVDVRTLSDAAHRLMAGSCVDPTDLALRRYCERELLAGLGRRVAGHGRGKRLQQMQLHVLEAIPPCTCVEAGPLSGWPSTRPWPPSRSIRCARAPTAPIIRAHLAEGNNAAAVRNLPRVRADPRRRVRHRAHRRDHSPGERADPPAPGVAPARKAAPQAPLDDVAGADARPRRSLIPPTPRGPDLPQEARQGDPHLDCQHPSGCTSRGPGRDEATTGGDLAF